MRVIIILIFITILIGAFCAQLWWNLLTDDAVLLKAERQRLEIQKDIATLEIQQKKLDVKQEILAANPVKWAKITTATLLNAWPVVLIFGCGGGILAYQMTHVPVKAGDIETSVPRKAVVPIVTQALNVREVEARVQEVALSDEAMAGRFKVLVEAVKMLKTELRGASQVIDVTPEPVALPVTLPAVTFHTLLAEGKVEPEKPLIFGVTAEQVEQYRSVSDIKAMLIAGWQGSGKTLSIVYIISCLLLQYPQSRGWVIDPHSSHPEGLADYIRPYTGSGRMILVNAFDTERTILFFQARLNARLAGIEPSTPLLFLVIDELPRMGRTEVFTSHVKPFLDRCTEETRKAGILFFGGGTKWQAKYFKGDASFRQSVPSVLVHKSKPSQAELLLEDSQEKKMVKQLQGAGSALLATSHDADPCVVQMPLMTRADVDEVSHLLTPVSTQETFDTLETQEDTRTQGHKDTDLISQILGLYESGHSWQSLADEIQIERSYLRKVCRGEKNMSENLRKKIRHFLS